MKLNKKIKMLDLFAGCGGLTDGFMQTKCFDDIAAVEWKEPQVRTLRHRLKTMQMKEFYITMSKKKQNYLMDGLMILIMVVVRGWIIM